MAPVFDGNHCRLFAGILLAQPSFQPSVERRASSPSRVLLTERDPSLAAAVAHHLQAGDLQVSVLRFAGCILHLSLFFLFCLFCLRRLVCCGTGDGHFVTDVLIQT